MLTILNTWRIYHWHTNNLPPRCISQIFVSVSRCATDAIRGIIYSVQWMVGDKLGAGIFARRRVVLNSWDEVLQLMLLWHGSTSKLYIVCEMGLPLEIRGLMRWHSRDRSEYLRSSRHEVRTRKGKTVCWEHYLRLGHPMHFASMEDALEWQELGHSVQRRKINECKRNVARRLEIWGIVPCSGASTLHKTTGARDGDLVFQHDVAFLRINQIMGK